MELEQEIQDLQSEVSIERLVLEPVSVPCRKGDLQIDYLGIVWVPWEVDQDGIARRLVDLEQNAERR